jgi:putative hydrolase of the HAD superfamily
MMRSPAKAAEIAAVMALFDAVIESSKAGVRKPEPAFYRIACEAVGASPREVVFLDDLGVNLKPAREMGMTTIKVASAAQAIGELESLLGLRLR